MKVYKILRRAAGLILLFLVAAVLLIEEWGWGPLTRFAARVARWPPLSVLEGHIVRVSPRVALALFLVPAVLLFPVKLAALWLMRDGWPLSGIMVILGAKVFGTALVGRLFILLEPQLLRFRWFARALTWWRDTKARLLSSLRGSRVWRRGSMLFHAWRARFRAAA